MSNDIFFNGKVVEALARTYPQIPCVDCPSGNPSFSICVSPKCKQQPYQCANKKCPHCKNIQHSECQVVRIEEVTSMLRSKMKKYKKAVSLLVKLEIEVVQAIRQQQKKLIGRLINGKKVLQKMDVHKLNKLSKQEMVELFKVLKDQRTIKIDMIQSQLRQSTKRISFEIKTCITNLNTRIYEEIVPQIVQVDSEVLRLKGTVKQDMKFISKALLYPSKLSLIFRASQHAFKAKQFHQCCDKFNDTLILIRTEFGKTIGGYSHYRWGQEEQVEIKRKDFYGDIYVQDAEQRSFLLQLDLRQKLLPFRDKHLIYCEDNWGPDFGGGWDLHIGNECNINQHSSKSMIGGTYNIEGPNRYKWKSKQSFKAFIGNTESQYFKVVQYEVFRVIW